MTSHQLIWTERPEEEGFRAYLKECPENTLALIQHTYLDEWQLLAAFQDDRVRWAGTAAEMKEVAQAELDKFFAKLVPVAEPMITAEATMFDVFNECLSVRPHLIIEVGFNRIADWGVHIYDGTNVGIKAAELIISTQSGNRSEAMADASKQLQERFLS
jgi:hypothetical protein